MENFIWTDELVKKFANELYIDTKAEDFIERFKASHASLGDEKLDWVVGESADFDAMLIKENGVDVENLKVTGQILSINYDKKEAELFFTHPFLKQGRRILMYFKHLYKPQPLPLPTRTKLFTTSDGKDIFIGDTVYYSKYWEVDSWVIENKDAAAHDCKTFSTEAAAKEFITLNKKLFSVKDIWEVSAKYGFLLVDFEKDIQQLAKKKLNMEG